MNLFSCPICGAPLSWGEKSYVCPSLHCYDIAKEGYVHLLPANRVHSKAPGDDRGMVAGRTRFLDKGYYAPLRQALCRLALQHTGAQPCVLDAGCGEGYYTAGLADAFFSADRRADLAGIDLSKAALRHAAKRTKRARFAAASVYHLPVADGALDLVVNCFSPLAADEFLRVLKPGGTFLYVVPAQRHLWQLKEILYDAPYENPLNDASYEGLCPLETTEVSARIHVADKGDIAALFQMTPYYWKTPKAGAERLSSLTELDTEIAFRILAFQKTPSPPHFVA